MDWVIKCLEGIREAALDGTFRELLMEFLATLFVMSVAYFFKNLPKNWAKLKIWWKTRNFKEKLLGMGVLVLVCVGAYCAFSVGLRLWEDYIQPVRYLDTEVSFYAGGEDAYNHAQLNHPECIAAEGVDTIYVWDSGEIHELNAFREETYGIGNVQTNKSKFIQPGDDGLGYYAVDALRVRNGELYALTTPWRDDSAYPSQEHCDYRFTILRVRGGDRNIEGIENAGRIPSNVTDMMDEPFFAGTDWMEMRFTDFLFSNNGSTLWLTRQDIGGGTVILQKISHVADEEHFFTDNLEWYADLHIFGVNSLQSMWVSDIVRGNAL